VGSRPPVCFAKYAESAPPCREVDEPVTQSYLTNYTPGDREFQRRQTRPNCRFAPRNRGHALPVRRTLLRVCL